MRTPEYRGAEALKDFEKLATAIFQAPKGGERKTLKKSSKKASEHKPESDDKG
jgi:hypothetical protein